jgi:predicted transposase/invertase (TIGR01784 family)
VSKKLPHDSFFKSALSVSKVALEFMKTYLPYDIINIVELNTLKIEQGSFVKDNTKQKISDVLFSCKTIDSNAYIYALYEHQSTPDSFMPLRILEYILCIWNAHLAKFPDTKKLPIIIPLVFYNGKVPYNAPINLYDLCQNPEIARQYLHSYKLIDISKKEGIQEQDTKWLATMEFFMKNAFEQDVVKLLQQFTPILQKIARSKQGLHFIESILWYNITKLDQQQLSSFQTTMRNIITDRGKSEEVLGSLVSSWKTEGINIGKAEGINIGKAEGRVETSRQIAQKLLKTGLNLAKIAKITGLTLKDIKTIAKS